MTIQKLFHWGMDRTIPDVLDFPMGPVLDLGAGEKKIFPGAIRLSWPDWDSDVQPIPMENSSVAGIHAYHFLEHLRNPVKCLLEMERVLMPGGVANIVVPYYNSQAMAQDLDHKHAFCEDSWKNLFNNGYYHMEKKWNLRVGTNIIIGVVERNLCLLTQLIKE